MITSKSIKVKNIVKWSWKYFAWLSLFNGIIMVLYHYKIIYINIPWLPVSVIGTAVAFYIGFKNNNAYDRLWEARKVWGGIVNESRTWAMMVDGYISNKFTENNESEADVQQIKKRLIYRHIAWLYAHRSQLLIPTSWEDLSQKGAVKKKAEHFYKNFGVGLLADDITLEAIHQFLPKSEYERLINYTNTATQIINEQSRDLTDLKRKEFITDFDRVEMQDVLRSFYTLQGKNERIKKFPLPRQYSSICFYFIIIFIFLLPFSMIPEMVKTASYGSWVSIPITSLIGWVYLIMERIGDSSENPFQGSINDIPMMSLCRTIEIDMREMLNETDLPPAIKEINGVLN